MFEFSFNCDSPSTVENGINSILKALYQPDVKFNADEYVKLLNREIEGKIKIWPNGNYFIITFSTDKADDNNKYDLTIPLYIDRNSDIIFMSNQERTRHLAVTKMLENINENIDYINKNYCCYKLKNIKSFDEIVFIKELGFSYFAYKDDICTYDEYRNKLEKSFLNNSKLEIEEACNNIFKNNKNYYLRTFYTSNTMYDSYRTFELVCDKNGDIIANEYPDKDTGILTIQDFFDGKVDIFGNKLELIKNNQ